MVMDKTTNNPSLVQRTATAERALPGPTIVHLMRAQRLTIRALAQRMNITQKRVRQVRAHGVRGELFVHDWLAGIQGEPPRTTP